MQSRLSQQRGVSIIFALFVVTVIGLLSAGLLQLTQTDSAANSGELLAFRAFMAAESGLQNKMTALYPPSTPEQVDVTQCVDSALTFSTPGLQYCSANLSCVNFNVADVEYFRITSTGVCQVGNDPTQAGQRQIRIEARCDNGPLPNC